MRKNHVSCFGLPADSHILYSVCLMPVFERSVHVAVMEQFSLAILQHRRLLSEVTVGSAIISPAGLAGPDYGIGIVAKCLQPVYDVEGAYETWMQNFEHTLANQSDQQCFMQCM